MNQNENQNRNKKTDDETETMQEVLPDDAEMVTGGNNRFLPMASAGASAPE